MMCKNNSLGNSFIYILSKNAHCLKTSVTLLHQKLRRLKHYSPRNFSISYCFAGSIGYNKPRSNASHHEPMRDKGINIQRESELKFAWIQAKINFSRSSPRAFNHEPSLGHASFHFRRSREKIL